MRQPYVVCIVCSEHLKHRTEVFRFDGARMLSVSVCVYCARVYVFLVHESQCATVCDYECNGMYVYLQECLCTCARVPVDVVVDENVVSTSM